MKLVARRFAWLLPLVLSACVHNTNQSQMQSLAPPIEDAPPPPDIAPTVLPAPEYNIPKTQQTVALPPQPIKPPPKHHKSSAKTSTAAQANPAPGAPTNQVAAEAPPVEESAFGKFETPEAPDSKKQTENSISDIEKGLNGISRHLNDTEEKTSTQIKEFLKQARSALASGDLVGAKNLAQKAKDLLGELSQ